eukprot:scaffold3_cov273-Pinguiococcus_pyrenoidosus.AAC.5
MVMSLAVCFARERNSSWVPRASIMLASGPSGPCNVQRPPATVDEGERGKVLLHHGRYHNVRTRSTAAQFGRVHIPVRLVVHRRPLLGREDVAVLPLLPRRSHKRSLRCAHGDLGAGARHDLRALARSKYGDVLLVHDAGNALGRGGVADEAHVREDLHNRLDGRQVAVVVQALAKQHGIRLALPQNGQASVPGDGGLVGLVHKGNPKVQLAGNGVHGNAEAIRAP